MAISATHYRLLKELREAGELAVGKPILEIGQANHYGDGNARDWFQDIAKFIDDPVRRGQVDCKLRQLLASAQSGLTEPISFAFAEIVYEILLGATKPPDSIDRDGFRDCCRDDLNAPIQALKRYSTVINHGTAEHIFNIAQVFRTMHDATEAGGLMVHESPFTGWVDHGFYCLQPTLFYDLAAANSYKVVMLATEHIASQTTIKIESQNHLYRLALADQLPYNAMLFVALRKTVDAPFEIPQQGVYAGRANPGSWKQGR